VGRGKKGLSWSEEEEEEMIPKAEEILRDGQLGNLKGVSYERLGQIVKHLDLNARSGV
jgi:hypothetical protein